jgi:hypothetical protein
LNNANEISLWQVGRVNEIDEARTFFGILHCPPEFVETIAELVKVLLKKQDLIKVLILKV